MDRRPEHCGRNFFLGKLVTDDDKSSEKKNQTGLVCALSREGGHYHFTFFDLGGAKKKVGTPWLETLNWLIYVLCASWAYQNMKRKHKMCNKMTGGQKVDGHIVKSVFYLEKTFDEEFYLWHLKKSLRRKWLLSVYWSLE